MSDHDADSAAIDAENAAYAVADVANDADAFADDDTYADDDADVTTSILIRLERCIVTIALLDQWLATIENHCYQWLTL